MTAGDLLRIVPDAAPSPPLCLSCASSSRLKWLSVVPVSVPPALNHAYPLFHRPECTRTPSGLTETCLVMHANLQFSSIGPPSVYAFAHCTLAPWHPGTLSTSRSPRGPIATFNLQRRPSDIATSLGPIATFDLCQIPANCIEQFFNQSLGGGLVRG